MLLFANNMHFYYFYLPKEWVRIAPQGAQNMDLFGGGLVIFTLTSQLV